MKKIIIILFVIVVSLVINLKKKELLIPDNSIRFRVIANSDSIDDQKVKIDIKNEVEKKIYSLINVASSIEEARQIITDNLSVVNNIINKYNVDYKISFGDNYFPIKEYKGITYEAGNYESLVITIGEGLGENWWCVLFPPLCLISDDENLENAEYEFFVKKIINKYK